MLNDILEMMLQGQQGQAAPAPSTGGDPLSDLLGGILGGQMGGTQPAPAPQQAPASGVGSSGILGGLLDAFLGGSMGATGGTSSIGSNPMLAPITEALAEKLGISPQMAAVIVSAAFALLMNQLQNNNQQSGGRGVSTDSLDLDNLLDSRSLQQSGIASRVAQQTGLDEATAVSYLQEATTMLAGKPAQAPRPAPKPASSSQLDHLLDSWETD